MPGDSIDPLVIFECDNCQAQIGAPLIYCRWHGIRLKVDEWVDESNHTTYSYFRIPERILVNAARLYHRRWRLRPQEIEYSDREEMPQLDEEGLDEFGNQYVG
ncbi:hypothetical protein K435DRAFT_856345 [Dendrothele bispora CBS 962.96]|uniref:Uncharacterized protein n=1 Tax=Dendrothele bispora (strain CBS 962.96) TaxID=1314807 RepID=A0A4S8M8N0_DENBC|nr:hypothetical protein K435DRAFT_856345 [Dendrothele bispora CBS 962.96]